MFDGSRRYRCHGRSRAFLEKRVGERQQWRGRMEARRGFGGHEVSGRCLAVPQVRSGRAILNIGPAPPSRPRALPALTSGSMPTSRCAPD